MREIVPSLTTEIKDHCSEMPVWRAPGFQVSTFRALVEHVARLAYANREQLLLFRGQDQDYQNRADGTTLYPPIYRGDVVPLRELKSRFDTLDRASGQISDRMKMAGFEGHAEVRRKRYVQWSILQHYEVAATPLLDVTQSLRVACSFAMRNNKRDLAFVYVLGLPYPTNRISANSEQDTVLVRLLSICPPTALRPYFQEGYLVGTSDATTDFDSKTELDFRNRLIAKFSIPNRSSFWSAGFDPIPETALFPRGDSFLELCRDLREQLQEELEPGEIGEFIRIWSVLEKFLVETARERTGRNISIREAISRLLQMEVLTAPVAREIESLRRLRNNLVHKPEEVIPSTLSNWIGRLQSVTKQLQLPRP